ncbi:AraC family transcriptional regulator [Algisphaera agarilytica]|uniref:AraC family transcriptional regulator n=1 Tax=Algisphaera agarilytica TaxID=1385975 RepID=UPI001C87119F|nr:AraC family transcriptional regulator [Algisphaera agarilytica]
MVYPHGLGWQRGGGTLDTEGRATPRLIHAAWHQDIPVVPRRSEHTHDVYHIGLVHEGESSMLLDSREVSTRPGSLLIVSPGQPHCFLLPPRTRSVYSEVTFELVDRVGKSLRDPLHDVLAEWTGTDCPAWITGTVVKPDLKKTVADAIARVVMGCMTAPPRRQFLVNRALMDLLEEIASAGRAISDVADDPIAQVAALIEANLQEPISVNEMAEQVSMSPNHLIRRFRDHYGTTPLAYRQQLRLEAAISLLTMTHYPIKLIAEWTGFSSVYYFSRFFTSKVGTSPAAYREQANHDQHQT